MKPTNEKLAADILSAGKKEFLEKGFQGASMRSIASSLAVTTGQFIATTQTKKPSLRR